MTALRTPSTRQVAPTAPGTAPPTVELTDVLASYDQSPSAKSGSFSLEVPQLRIEPGERVACIGPSGSGKTTLVHLLCGLLAPLRGSVRVLDTELARAGSTQGGLSEAARRQFRLQRLGLVFQDLALVDYLSARDNIRLASFLGASERGSAARARAEDLGRALGLAAQLGRKPAQLSQGERQRVAIARALFTRPELCLCDEPTGHLDSETAAYTLELFFDAVRQSGASVFFVTHDHALLSRFDRVVDTALLGRHAAGKRPERQGRPGRTEQPGRAGA